jgi:orotidine-5'-phosphate decarboxylase
MSTAATSIRDKIYCAIDTPDAARAEALAAALAGAVGGIKLGLEFFTAHGADGVGRVMDKANGADLFLDLKFHDIPNTVAAAMRAAAPIGARLINVHASGGTAMMQAARDAAKEGAQGAGLRPPMVLGVTVLTSLDGGDLDRLGIMGSPQDQVVRLATLAAEAGLDGVVCSAREIAALRAALGPDFVLVTPGIRPAGADAGDQKRVVTPAQAIRDGADYLVMGRPITGEADPAAAALRIAREAAEALA